MLMALNTRGFDHKNAYKKSNIVIDANYSQVERAKIEPDNITSIIRFSYAENSQIIVEKFDQILVEHNVTTKNFDLVDSEQGLLFFGRRISREVMNKDSVAIIYPKAINKLGHFNQFTLKLV